MENVWSQFVGRQFIIYFLNIHFQWQLLSMQARQVFHIHGEHQTTLKEKIQITEDNSIIYN